MNLHHNTDLQYSLSFLQEYPIFGKVNILEFFYFEPKITQKFSLNSKGVASPENQGIYSVMCRDTFYWEGGFLTN